MPLRGFLLYPKCTRKLTGSAPGAKVTRIYYYHCHSKCGARIRANVLNAKFAEHIENFKLESKFVPLFSIALNDAYQNQLKEKKNLKVQIEGTPYITCVLFYF